MRLVGSGIRTRKRFDRSKSIGSDMFVCKENQMGFEQREKKERKGFRERERERREYMLCRKALQLSSIVFVKGTGVGTFSLALSF